MRLRSIGTGLALLAASGFARGQAVETPLSVEQGQFVDVHGRRVILRGLNLGEKRAAKNYQSWHGPREFAAMRAWGMNLIRLQIFWDGIEPRPGFYDEAYLAQLDRRIAWAKEQGLYVLLDMHQDLFSRTIGCNGAPPWATLDDGQTNLRLPGGPWSLAYLTSRAVQVAFDNFWDDRPGPDGVGIQERFALAWQQVAKRYADEPAVVGYDLFNEPFPGSAVRQAALTAGSALLQSYFGDPTASPFARLFSAQEGRQRLLEWLGSIALYQKVVDAVEPVAQRFERNQLIPFYGRVARAIREVDPATLLFLQPCVLSNLGLRSALRAPLLKDGTPDRLVVYAPHAYDILSDTPLVRFASEARIEFVLHRHLETARRIGPLFLGEWGAYYESPDVLDVARAMTRQLEAARCSDVYWDFRSGLDQSVFFELLQRPFPVALAGEPVAFHFDGSTASYACSWIEKSGVDAPTRIYVPDRWYPDGFTVQLWPQGQGHSSHSIHGENFWVDIPPADPRGPRRLLIRPR